MGLLCGMVDWRVGLLSLLFADMENGQSEGLFSSDLIIGVAADK